jgi:hypothetical protein
MTDPIPVGSGRGISFSSRSSGVSISMLEGELNYY